MTAQLIGDEKLLAFLKASPGICLKALGAALYEKGETTMTEAKRRTPVDTGNLRNSGHVQPPETKGETVTVTLAFGGAAASYAIFVHENLTAHHPVGQSKFLESAVLETEKGLGEFLAQRLRGEMHT